MSAQMKPDTAENVGAFHRYLQESKSTSTTDNWVLVADGAVRGAFATYEAAFRKGIEDFADLAFLIREAKEEVHVVPFVFTEA